MNSSGLKNFKHLCVSPPKTADVAPVIISSVFGHSSKEVITARPEAQKDELKLNMVVLARRRPMRWQRGKIVEIVTRGKRKFCQILQ